MFKCLKTKDLLKNLESELKGNFERLFKTLMRVPAQAEAKDLMNAIDGVGTNEAALIGKQFCEFNPTPKPQLIASKY